MLSRARKDRYHGRSEGGMIARGLQDRTARTVAEVSVPEYHVG